MEIENTCLVAPASLQLTLLTLGLCLNRKSLSAHYLAPNTFPNKKCDSGGSSLSTRGDNGEWERLSGHPWWFHLIAGLERQLILKAYLLPPLERFIRATDFVFDTSNCIWLIGYTSICFARRKPASNLFLIKDPFLRQNRNLVFLFWEIIAFVRPSQARVLPSIFPHSRLRVPYHNLHILW